MKTCPPFFRLASNRVWRTYLGGRTLDEIAGKPSPEDSHFPEEWILSATRAVNPGRENPVEGISVTEDGTLLTDWLKQFPEAILGMEFFRRHGATPGFLVKFLDSSIRLHLQCHPSIPFAKARLHSNSGKSEGYVILGCRPGVEPYIYLGFQRPPPRAEFRRILVEQDIPAMLACFEKIPVKPGDVFFVPGGLPHAIGEGVFMIELMEPTDFAVRMEFERGGCVLPESARFMNRGVDFALDMLDFTRRSVAEIRRDFFCRPRGMEERPDFRRVSLLDERYTPCFGAESIELRGKAELESDSFRVLIVTKGNGELSVSGKSAALHLYDRILIPACERKITLRSADGMTVTAALPPTR